MTEIRFSNSKRGTICFEADKVDRFIDAGKVEGWQAMRSTALRVSFLYLRVPQLMHGSSSKKRNRRTIRYWWGLNTDTESKNETFIADLWSVEIAFAAEEIGSENFYFQPLSRGPLKSQNKTRQIMAG